MSRPFTVCVLLYGPHTDLAKRCLGSIAASLGPADSEAVWDFRIGLNEVHAATAIYVNGWASDMSARGFPVNVLSMPRNAYKYPVMREMFYGGETTAKYTMWFDDDSYLIPMKGWWNEVLSQFRHNVDMVGQLWRRKLQGNQHLWLADQPWAQADKVKKGQVIDFCQGSWWVIRTSILCGYNWPIPELRHCGGDQLLGALFKHQGLSIRPYSERVRLNADEEGRHSKAERRGYSEGLLGHNYVPGTRLDCSHQQFEHSWNHWPAGGVVGVDIVDPGL